MINLAPPRPTANPARRTENGSVFAIELEGLMQDADGVFGARARDDARDADVRRADDVDVDPGAGQGAEHPRRLARSSAVSIESAPIFGDTDSVISTARSRLPREIVNDRSVVPSAPLDCAIVSTLMLACASGSKMAAATPGRSGTRTSVMRATSVSWAIPRTFLRISIGICRSP